MVVAEMFCHENFGWKFLVAISSAHPLTTVHLLLVVNPVMAGKILLIGAEAILERTNIWS